MTQNKDKEPKQITNLQDLANLLGCGFSCESIEWTLKARHHLDTTVTSLENGIRIGGSFFLYPFPEADLWMYLEDMQAAKAEEPPDDFVDKQIDVNVMIILCLRQLLYMHPSTEINSTCSSPDYNSAKTCIDTLEDFLVNHMGID